MTTQIASGDSLVKHTDIETSGKYKQPTSHPSRQFFFLSAWTNRWALHHSPSRHKDWLCEHMAVWKWEGFQKEGLSAEKGRALPEDTTRSQKYSLRCKTRAELEPMTQGNAWLVWVRITDCPGKSLEQVWDISQIHRIKLNRKWCCLGWKGSRFLRDVTEISQSVHFKVDWKNINERRNNFKLAEVY